MISVISRCFTFYMPLFRSYGLVLKGKAKGGLGPAKSLDELVEQRHKKPAVFHQGSDEDDESKKNETAKTKPSVTEARNKKLVEMQHEKALAEDPSAFSYDSVYGEMVAKRTEKLESEKKADKDKKPKYIQQLLRAAEKREREQIARDERKQHQERQLEGDKFKDHEVFVTGAYKKQMEEMQKYKEEEARKEIFEARMDVTKQKDLTGFYKHLLNDTLAREGNSTQTQDTDEKTTVKNEPTDTSTTESKEVSDAKSEKSEKKKQKSYRRREDSDSESSESEEERIEKPEKEKKSIYSESESSENEERRKEPSTKSGGLELVAKKSREERGMTKAERAKRFFTPTPPSSPEPKRKERKKRKATEDDKREGKTEKSPKRKEERKKRKKSERDGKEDKGSEVKEKEREKDPVKERLEKLKELFAHKNSLDQIDAYRKRYFERKAAGEIVAPV